MSDSRLEKFIYAICSMDVSDLPVPLSRIEKLWNCLITGETPDFEPLSRNEKYLMAMLDRYDISNLPAPMSRGEKLLYKIAVGETDLSDVPGYLSRYEELLKYLIENGENSEDDFEYVLYTLNQSLYTLYTTAEKPVKSAILKGQTLVNLINLENFTSSSRDSLYTCDLPVKNNTTYTVIATLRGSDKIFTSTESVFRIKANTNNGDDLIEIQQIMPDDISTIINLCQTIKVTTQNNLHIRLFNTLPENLKIIILEGDYTNVDTPYFEGMQSVKMPVLTTTGKNLFYSTFNYGFIDANGIINTNAKDWLSSDYIKLNKGTYTMSSCEPFNGVKKIAIYDDNKTFINTTTTTFTLEGDVYIRVGIKLTSSGNILENQIPLAKVQIEKGTTATSYEPFKSNILTVNEEVTLRGIGDVRDELDCLTGEVTERIGEVVFDGSDDENWYLDMSSNNSTRLNMTFKIDLDNIIDFDSKTTGMLCDKFTQISGVSLWLNDVQGIGSSYGNGIKIGIPKSNLTTQDVNGFKTWLSQNHVTVQYQLKTPTIKSVDLTVVDQDNQPTELGTFENVTHVSLEAENLIPEVEMEVATNLLEDTVFNLTNAFNTLYPTAAKPVVDGTLYGQTISSVSNYKILTGKYLDINNGTFIDGSTNHKYIEDYFVIPEGTQVITLKGVNNYKKICYYDGNKRFIIGYNLPTQNPDDFTTDVPTGASYFRFNTSLTEILGSPIVVDEYLHVYVDDYLYLTNKPDYIEGAKLISCQAPCITMIGKNLFDGEIEEGVFDSNGNPSNYVGRTRSKNFIKVPKNTDLYISMSGANNISWTSIYFYNDKKEHTEIINTSDVNKTFNTGNNSYIKWKNNSPMSQITNIQIEQGSVATSYEPFKSNILTTPEDLELRGIGDVQDTLDCLTGRVTERIGEIVFNGSENWDADGNLYFIAINEKVLNSEATSNYLQRVRFADFFGNSELIGVSCQDMGAYSRIYIRINANYSKEETIQYLQQNPLTVQYALATESVKTVDLTVVDQDGNVTTLRTFDDTTHVLLESEGLIPTAALTVRTKIPSASSTSLLMDDISTKQEHLNTTIDEQSENVDATMIATTEIFEETL